MKELIKTIKEEIKNNITVPYFGLGIFEGTKTNEGEEMPYDSDSMILTLNSGRPMSQRLMFEYSRAAMHLEERRGVSYLTQLVNHIYTKNYEPTPLHKIIIDLAPKYIIDTNRDPKIQELLANKPHSLIIGKARIMADKNRYEVYKYDVENKLYHIALDGTLNEKETILFKPMGSTLPEPSFVMSDADYVDWLTEAMGGFAVPPYLKKYRKEKKYLFLGTSFDRDTDRMVANELTFDSVGGYVITDKELGKKEKKFVEKHNLIVLKMSLEEFIKQIKEIA
ncbi:MAG: SIR2 family protein [Campylobacterales bacterium]|nr:SIR2 family protein [Campylobacterales bacterium]